MKSLAILHAFLLALCLASNAGESGVSIERGDRPAADFNRQRLARTIYSHNFENIRDPDSGRMLPQSAALGPDNWPDFWEPIRAVGFPEYLIPTVRVAQDDSGTVPGAYRDVPNHALTMDFDGTRIGVRTRTPVPVDPDLAYEYSLLIKDQGLQGARIRTGVDWMRIDPASSTILRSDEIPDLRPGQTDWPVVPFSMLVNDPPPEANAARLFVVVDRDPAAVGGAYHGTIAVDDITLRPLPKITVEAPRPASAGDGHVIPVRYHGLIDNIPDPDNPGYFKGGRYSRRVEITDVFGVPAPFPGGGSGTVHADDAGASVEEIPFPRDRYGVYYFNIRLYDAGNNLLTDVIRSVAVMRPPAPAADWAIHSVKPIFGADTGPVPDSVLARSGFLRTALERAGMKIAKITPWQESPSGDDESRRHYQSLAEEVRHLRSAGIGVVGVIAPPKAVFDSDRLRTALEARPDRLGAILADAGRHLGLFVDTWQWGDDGDDSFAGIPAGPALDGLASTLRDFAGAMPVAANAPFVMPVAANAPFVPGERPAFPIRPDIVQARMPDTVQAAGLWPLAAGVFPWLFEPYYNLRGSIYPPENLAVLAPGPAADRLEEEARLARRGGSWISLEAPPARSHEPNAAAERVQLEEMMIRAVYAAVLAPDAVFLGSLFDPARGLLRQADAGGTTLETMARPSYLAAATLVRFLEGASYLGRLWLLPPFEAHAFRLPGTNAAVIAVWHNDPRGELTIPRVEIANGPDLAVVDWAGNREPVPADVRVRRAPSFITGVPADLLLTRMSARVVPDPPMLAMNRRQAQAVEMVNHMDRQAPVLLRLRYAARLPEGAMENNWMQQPAEMRLNLPPVTPDLEAGLLRYEVTPDANSLIQIATPDGADKSGLKIAQARMFFHTSPAADMTVYLPFRLRSDIDLDVTALATEESSQFVVLQLKLRWFPSGDNRRRGDIKLTPYYMKRGRMKESAAFPVTVKAQDPSLRGQADAPFDSIELRIPRSPRARTWVGLDEVGGSRFYIADVTAFLDGE